MTVTESLFPGFDTLGVSPSTLSSTSSSRPTRAQGTSGGSVSGGKGGSKSLSGDQRVGLFHSREGVNVSCCGGKVKSRSGNVFCTRAPEVCKVKSHAEDKHPVLAKRLYKRFPSGDKAHLTGSITVEEVGGLFEGLLKEKRSSVEWDAEFKNLRVKYAQSLDEALGSGDTSVRDLWEELEVETSSPVILMGPSPVKVLKTRGATTMKDATDEAWTEIKSTFQPSEYKTAPTISPVAGDDGWIKSKDKVFRTIHALTHNDEKTRKFIAAEHERMVGVANSLGKLTSDVDSKVVLLSSAIGQMQPAIFAGDDDINTVWDALQVVEHDMATDVKGILTSVAEVTDRVTTVETASSTPPGLTQAEAAIEEIKKALKEQFAPTLKVLMENTSVIRGGGDMLPLIDRLLALESMLPSSSTTAASRVASVDRDPFGLGLPGPNSDMRKLEDRLDAMAKRVAAVESENTTLKARLDTASAVGNTGGPQPPPSATGGGTMDDLFRRIKELEDSIDSEVIMVNRVPFGGVSDCAKFIFDHIPGQKFDMFYDVVSLLHRGTNQSMEMKDTLKEDEQLAKTGYNTRSAGVIVSSLRTLFPAALGTGKSTAAVPIPGLKTVEEFGLAHNDGDRGRIKDSVEASTESIRDHIGDTVQAAEVSLLAMTLLNGAEDGWTTIQDFLISAYNNLEDKSDKTKESKKRNWVLVTRIVLRLFETLNRLRAPASNLPIMASWGDDPSVRAYFSGQILWATLRTYAFMANLKKVGMGKSPLAVTEYTNYLVEGHVHPVALKALADKQAALENKFNSFKQRSPN